VDAFGGKDKVEPADVQHTVGFEHITDHKRRVEPKLVGELPGKVDRRLREVNADHRRPPASQGQRVRADVTLQMRHTQPRDVAKFLSHDRRKRIAPGPQRVKVPPIHRRRQMHRHPRVPTRPIDVAGVHDDAECKPKQF